jgi:predicted transcriptional regulator
VKTQNVTLSLPEPLLRRFRVYAAERNKSMTALMTEAIRKMVDEESSREAATRRILERIRNAPDWGTGGKITWTRDEIWERCK